MPASARSLLALVQRVQEGSVPAQHLQHALEGAAARIGKSILPAPRSATELQSLRDPAFEHLGHKLEELGRALVEKLSEELDTSELLCWELLLHENELATEAAPAPTELMLRAKQSYRDEREHMLLLLLDCFKLSLLDPATNPAQTAATAFIAKLEAGGGGGGATPVGALGSLGGAPAAAGGEALSMQLLRAVAAGATNPAGLPADPHRRKELTQACVCLLLLCHAQKRPPHTVAAGLCTLLRQVSAQLGACAVSEILLLAALAMLLPRPAAPLAEEQAWLAAVRDVLRPWRQASGGGQPVGASGLGFSEGAAMALWFAAGLLADNLAPPPPSAAPAAGAGTLAVVGGAAGGAAGAAGATELLEPGRGEIVLGFLQARGAQLRGVGGDTTVLPEVALCAGVYHQLLLLLLSQLTPADKSASGLHGPVAHAAEPRGTAVFDALYAQPEALRALLRWAAALHRAAPRQCEPFWADDAGVSFAHLTGCRLAAQPQLYEEYMRFLAAVGRGSNPAAESCHLLLERVAASVKSISPAYMLAHELPLIVPFVRQRLEQLEYLTNRGLSVQGHDAERELVDVCFPKWSAVLALLGALASRSPRLRTEWSQPATTTLVQLIKVGVSPALKAAALRTLRAFALPSPPPARLANAPPVVAAGVAEVAAEAIWRALTAPVLLDGQQPQQPPTQETELELLAGLKKDLEVEQRHQEYPQTLAFVRLVRRLLSSCASASRPPPPGLTRHVAWIGEEVFGRFEAFGFRHEEHKWELASGCLAAMVQAVRDYSPDACDAQEAGSHEEDPVASARWLVAIEHRGVGGGWVWMPGDGAAAAPHGAPPLPPAGGAPPPTYSYELPELPPALHLLCAFAAPRSPLLHKLLWLLAHASILLGRPPAQLGTPPEHAPAVYRAAALALQLLQLLLLREAPLAEKLGRMRAAHERVRKWACWRPEQAEALARLHSELWRAMPPAGSPAGGRLAHTLSESLLIGEPGGAAVAPGAGGAGRHGALALAPAGFGGGGGAAAASAPAAPMRRSGLAATVVLLHAAAEDRPALVAAPLALAALCVLRRARQVLGGGVATLLRTEGVVEAARKAMLDCLEPGFGHDAPSSAAAAGSGTDGTGGEGQAAAGAAAGEAGGGEAMEELADEEDDGAEVEVLLLPPLALPMTPPLAPRGGAHEVAYELEEGGRAPAVHAMLLLLEDLPRARGHPNSQPNPNPNGGGRPGPAAAPVAFELLGLPEEREPLRCVSRATTALLRALLAYAARLAELLRRPTFAELLFELLATLASHARVGDAVLSLARAAPLVPPLLRALPGALAAATAAAAPAAAPAAPAAPDAAPPTPPAALLHALGFALKLGASELFAALRQPAGAAPRPDARPVIRALLLATEAAAPHAAPPEQPPPTDAMAAAAAAAAEEADAEPPLCTLMRSLWHLAQSAAAAAAAAAAPGSDAARAPHLARWRGEAEVELVNVAGLDQQLRQHGAQLGEEEVRARLRAAVRLNASQELLCGVLHALSGCRQLVLLLKPACADAPAAAALRPADPHLLAPRLRTLQALLQLLATPSAVAARLGEPLCACARSLLGSAGPALPLGAPAQLELIQLTLAALSAPQRMPAGCRRDLYLLLLPLLSLPRSADTLAWQHPQQPELRRQAGAMLHAAAPRTPLLPLLALDARDGGTAEQCVALSLIDCVLAYDHPSTAAAGAGGGEGEGGLAAAVGEPQPHLNRQPHLAQVCRGAWLGQLIEQVASEPAQLARRLCELLRTSPAPPRALDALCTYESLMALLLHALTRLHAAHADGGDAANAAALAAALHASGSLRLLARAPFLELYPRHLGDDAGAEDEQPGSEGGAAAAAARLQPSELHARLMVPLLRVLAATPAAGGEGSCAAASAGVLLDFVAGSEARQRMLLRLLKAPLRYGVARPVPLPLLRMAALLGALLRHLRARAGRALLAAHAGWGAGASEAYLGASLRLLQHLALRLSGDGDGGGAADGGALGPPPPVHVGAGAASMALVAPATPAAQGWLDLDDAEAAEREQALAAEAAAALEEALLEMLALCSHAAGCSGDLTGGGSGAADGGSGGGSGGGRLLFAPELGVLPGALASAAPPVGVLARVLGWAHGALRAADARHAQYVGLSEALPSLSAAQLRRLGRALAAGLPPARRGGAEGGVTAAPLASELLSPPAEYDHAQLSGLCDALLAAALQHCRQRASLYVRLLEHSLLLLWQHMRAWTTPPAGGGNHVSEAERIAGGALPEAELAELRLAANRPLALPGGGTAVSLASSLSKLGGYAPRLLGAAEEQMLLVHMLCRKAAEAL